MLSRVIGVAFATLVFGATINAMAPTELQWWGNLAIGTCSYLLGDWWWRSI
jgi:hypothetical protein